MSDKFSFRGGDPEGVPDGDYVLTVAGGHVTGLSPVGPGGGGGSIAIEDEGGETVAAASRLNFTGAGVTVTDAGAGEATVDIPGGVGGSSDTFDSVLATAAGLAHRWKFNDASGSTVADSVGTLPLTLSGTYTRAAAGRLGAASATNFGASAKAVSTGLGSIPTGSNERAIGIVYRTTGTTATQEVLLGYGTAGSRTNFGYILNNGGTTLNDGPFDGADAAQLPDAGSADGDWHLGVIGYRNQRIYVYLDGRFRVFRPGAALNTAGAGNLFVGQYLDGSLQFLGDVDDVFVLTSWPGKRLLDRLWATIPSP